MACPTEPPSPDLLRGPVEPIEMTFSETLETGPADRQVALEAAARIVSHLFGNPRLRLTYDEKGTVAQIVERCADSFYAWLTQDDHDQDDQDRAREKDETGAVFTRDNLPSGAWLTFQKTTPTRMIRITKPFAVETSEGLTRCEDGWLAVDARGWPYPIAADEQARTYEPADVSRETPSEEES